MSGDLRLTKDLFLWSISVIYLFAFASLFVQIPGLYGDKGILPARLVVQNEAESFHDLLTNQPTLLRLLPKVGLDIKTGMDFLSLGGIIVSFVAMVSHDYRNCVVFGVLWAFYLSLFQVGQTFLYFEWDLLLLEAGFLAVIVAPLNLFGLRDVTEHRAHDRITMWLVKWLLFRLTFASGIVKLLSESSTWWSLTALEHHYESQLLPTPMAWLFHQFPDWWHQLTAAAILTVQILVSLFFFSPLKLQRRFSLYVQIAFVLLFMLTGNYGFYQYLILTLGLSLADDHFIAGWIQHPTEAEPDHPKRSSWSDRLTALEIVFVAITSAAVLFIVFMSFSFNLSMSPLSLHPEIVISPEDLDLALYYLLPLTMAVGAISLTWQIGASVIKVLSQKCRHGGNRLCDLIGCAIFGLIATSLFVVSLVPHAAMQKDVESYVPEKLQDIYSWTSQNYHFVNPYNLYLKSADEGNGRLEIAIEGSNKLHGAWKEYSFRYKPNDVSNRLSIVAPHQPRLDSQMWFAARGRYDQNPWFLNFIFRLMKNEREVLELLDYNPFPDKPPKYLRAVLYRYQFVNKRSKTDKLAGSDWWTREMVQEYLPPLTVDEPSFVGYLMEAGIYYGWDEEPNNTEEHNVLYVILDAIRSLLGQGNGNLACILLGISGFVLTLVDPCIKFALEDEQLANGISARGMNSK